ncbi:MAG: TSUP family transporter [Bacteroidia bacterium]|nr:TSUP family transporter [Bacteroidia bacterium]
MDSQNHLFPVFLKLEHLHLLIVGGGVIGLEKITAVIKNSPATRITLVARSISTEIKELVKEIPNVALIERSFEINDLDNKDLVIAATGDRAISELIRVEATKRKILINVADTPDLCDFYLGSIVQKGDLKIAISTNGKSPTLAKRLKEVFNEALPEDTQITIDSLNKFRNQLKGDFAEKVKKLNEATAILTSSQNISSLQPHLVNTKKKTKKELFRYWLLYSLASIALMVLGHLLFTYVPFSAIGGFAGELFGSIDETVLIFIAAGFVAQMVDGSLGMAYGLSATTFLLSFGVTPAAASASVHASEIFTTGASGLSHLKFKNVNTKLFKNLLIPGIIGAIIGAYILSSAENYSSYIKPIVSIYTLILGITIIIKAIRKLNEKKKIKRIGILAFFGAFLDSIGGGGWGPIVSSTLIARGRNVRYTIGSVNLAEFFITLASSVTFFTIIGLQHWSIIIGLIIGGTIAAPIAAYFTSKIPVRAGLITVGIVVIIVSLRNILSGIF